MLPTLRAMSNATRDPRRLDVAQATLGAWTLEGQWPLAGFGRLDDDAPGADRSTGPSALRDTEASAARGAAHGNQSEAVTWQARAFQRKSVDGQSEHWLHLHAQVTLQRVCQRCLGLIDVPVRVDRPFRFVATEAHAAALDVDSEDDVLVLSHALDLHALVEDEIVLALPLVPMHLQCPQPLRQQQAPDVEPAHRPFSGLAASLAGLAGPRVAGKPSKKAR
jgi:uncharacterized protein